MRRAYVLIGALYVMLITTALLATLLLRTTNTTHQSVEFITSSSAYVAAHNSKHVVRYALDNHDINSTQKCINSMHITYDTFYAKVYIHYYGMPAHFNCTALCDDTNLTHKSALVDINIFTNENKNLYHYRYIEKLF